jgi:hypothetical protein
MRVIGVVERLQSVIAQTGPKAEYSAISAFCGPHVSSTRCARRRERDRLMKDAERRCARVLTPRLIFIAQLRGRRTTARNWRARWPGC